MKQNINAQLINKKVQVLNLQRNLNDFKDFIEYSNDMENIYRSSKECNPIKYAKY